MAKHSKTPNNADKNDKRYSKSAKQFENDKPEIARRYDIKISKPYGYYPEDVDKIIAGLETERNNLAKENKMLEDKVTRLQNDNRDIKSELNRIKMQIAVMPMIDSDSTAMDVTLLSGVNPSASKPSNHKISNDVLKKINQDASDDTSEDDITLNNSATQPSLLRKKPKKEEEPTSATNPDLVRKKATRPSLKINIVKDKN